MKIMCVADTHITPETPLDLAEGLGNFIIKRQPDAVVHLGDVADFGSLAYHTSKRSKYTFEDELKSVKDYFDVMMKPIKDYNAEQRRQHRKLYKPLKIVTLGNHDARNTAGDLEELLEAFDFLTIPHREVFTLEGINFSHSFERGTSGMECSSAIDILNNTFVNTVSGHGHTQQFASGHTPTGRRIVAVKCPCFREDFPEWAGQGAYRWDRGFTEIETFGYKPFEFVWRNLV